MVSSFISQISFNKNRTFAAPDTFVGLKIHQQNTEISHKSIVDSKITKSHLMASDCGFRHQTFNTQTCSRYAWYVHVFHLHKISSYIQTLMK